MDTFILILLIALAVAYVFYSIYRAIKGKQNNCGCSHCSCDDCSVCNKNMQMRK